MLCEEDIRNLHEIQKLFESLKQYRSISEYKDYKELVFRHLRNEQIIFVLRIYPKLGPKNSIPPKCTALFKTLDQSIITDIFELILEEVEDVVNFIGKMKHPQNRNIKSCNVKNSTEQVAIVNADDLFEKYNYYQLEIFAKEIILPMDTSCFSIMKKKCTIPLEYILLLQNLPGGLLPKPLKLYVNKIANQLEAVNRAEFNHRLNSIHRIEKEVLAGLSKEYNPKIIAEARYYRSCYSILNEKYVMPENQSFSGPEHKKIVAERLSFLIDKQGLTHVDLENKSDIKRQTFSALLNSNHKKNSIKTTTLYALARALHCSPDYLFGKVNSPSLRIDDVNAPLERVISKTQGARDYLRMAEYSGKSCSSAIKKLIEADNWLLYDEFLKIEKYIDDLMAQKMGNSETKR
jgi:transcriptional regulator with XRE-family HTH domain